MRLIVNNEPVGKELGVEYGASATRDVFGEGECDAVFARLAAELGWLQELQQFEEQLPQKSREALAEAASSPGRDA